MMPPDAVRSRTGEDTKQARELVLSATSGSTRAFHRLADRFQEEVFRMIYHRVRSRLDAEDLTQDVFLKAFRHISKLKKPEIFRSWLFSIALNHVRDFLRKRKFRQLLTVGQRGSDEADAEPVDPASLGGLSQLERRQFWDTVTRILGDMSVAEREVFMLRYFDQLIIADIARILKKGESTVKTLLYRAIEKFKVHPDSAELLEMLP